MTSSLVGSEMCIRDRLMTEQKPASTCLRLTFKPNAVGTISQGLGSRKSAVSYTHLDAADDM
eukprot:2002958-Prorocentrum_lima.AAC.1